MLHRIPASFTDKRTAQTALTEFRKRYRIALRGAVVIGPEYSGAYFLHVPLGGTGFSVSEFASALRAGNY